MISIGKHIGTSHVNRHYEGINSYLLRNTMAAKRLRLELLVSDFTNKQYNLEGIIKASYTEIETIIVGLWDAFPKTKKNRTYRNEIKLLKNLYRYLNYKDKYKYKDATGKEFNYDSINLFDIYNLRVCPYCNENFTYHFNNGKKNYELDHFYGKEAYPILAVSIYNFVPSCKVCNFFKLNKPNLILSPHVKYKLDDVLEFNLDVSDSDFLFDKSKFSVDYNILSADPVLLRMKENIEVFNIKERYNERKDLIIDLIIKKQLYNEEYINSLFESFEGKFFKNIEDVYRMIFSATLSEDDYSNHQFSKLLKDVFYDKNAVIT